MSESTPEVPRELRDSSWELRANQESKWLPTPCLASVRINASAPKCSDSHHMKAGASGIWF